VTAPPPPPDQSAPAPLPGGRAPRPARIVLIVALIASGVAPIVVCASLAIVTSGDLAARAVQALLGYCAVTAGFLGGVRWGAELARAPLAPSPVRLAFAAAPTIAAWGVLLLARFPRLACALLLAIAAAQLAWDLAASREGLLPSWVMPARSVVTIAAAVCILAVMLHTPHPDISP